MNVTRMYVCVVNVTIMYVFVVNVTIMYDGLQMHVLSFEEHKFRFYMFSIIISC